MVAQGSRLRLQLGLTQLRTTRFLALGPLYSCSRSPPRPEMSVTVKTSNQRQPGTVLRKALRFDGKQGTLCKIRSDNIPHTGFGGSLGNFAPTISQESSGVLGPRLVP